MRELDLSCLGLLLLAAACGDNSGGGFEGCGDTATQCGPSPSVPCSITECSFDPSIIDCPIACANQLAACAEGCGADANCTRSLSMEGCLQTCDLAPDASCENAMFGCYTLNNSCDSISQCLACGP